MDNFAVIGNPIEHSLSPWIHARFAEQTQHRLQYRKILGENAAFEKQVLDFFEKNGKGLNVTLPFKQRAFALAQSHTPRCQKAGAANTLWVKDDVLWADNTDGIGLVRDLQRHTHVTGKTLIIVGAGGAARGIIQPLLLQNPAQLILTNRTYAHLAPLQQAFPEITCLPLDKLPAHCDLLINATAASLSGEPLHLPKPCMQTNPLCYDLAYQRQGLTPFLAYASSFGCKTVDGLGMLVEQAAEAFYIWQGVMPDAAAVLGMLR